MIIYYLFLSLVLFFLINKFFLLIIVSVLTPDYIHPIIFLFFLIIYLLPIFYYKKNKKTLIYILPLVSIIQIIYSKEYLIEYIITLLFLLPVVVYLIKSNIIFFEKNMILLKLINYLLCIFSFISLLFLIFMFNNATM